MNRGKHAGFRFDIIQIPPASVPRPWHANLAACASSENGFVPFAAKQCMLILRDHNYKDIGPGATSNFYMSNLWTPMSQKVFSSARCTGIGTIFTALGAILSNSSQRDATPMCCANTNDAAPHF